MNEFIWLFLILTLSGTLLLILKQKLELDMERKMVQIIGWLFLSVGSFGTFAVIILYFFVDTP